MKVDIVGRNEGPNIETYKHIMSSIEFMQNYVEDLDVFTPDSVKFKNFLIQSFCYLHPDFHYLSFLNKEDVDLEIIKVATILQILPSSTVRICTKLFNNFTKDDIHRFWLKFFTLFKKQNDFSTDNIFNINWEDKINFFSDIKSTLNYVNYELPIINSSRLKNVDINEEVDIWTEQVVLTINIKDESTSLNYDEKQITDTDIEKLVTHLEQAVLLYSNAKPIHQEIKPEYIDFFNDFIHHSKSFVQYKRNLSALDFIFLKEFNCKLLSSDANILENFYFIKRCNNFVKTLKSKIKMP